MEPKIKETAWNPQLELQILRHWGNSHIYDFVPESKNFVIALPRAEQGIVLATGTGD